MNQAQQAQHDADMKFLQDVGATSAAIWQAYRQAQAQINQRLREGEFATQRAYDLAMQRALATANEQAATLKATAQDADARRRQAVAEERNGAKRLQRDPAQIALEHAAWTRVEPFLKRAAREPGGVHAEVERIAAQAVKRGDVATLRALQEELGSFMEFHELPDERERRARTGKAIEDDAVYQASMRAVEQAIVPMLPHEELTAYARERTLDPVSYAVYPNIAALENALSAGPSGELQFLYGWEAKTFHQLDPDTGAISVAISSANSQPTGAALLDAAHPVPGGQQSRMLHSGIVPD